VKPQEPIPHNYSMKTLHWIFAISSLVLLVTTGWIVMYDYVRGWKWFQLEFMRMQRERIESDLKQADDATLRQHVAALDAQIKAGEIDLAHHRREYVAAQKDLDHWEGEHYAADQNYRFAKATLDADRYETEAATVQHRADAADRRKHYDELTKHVNDLQLTLQQVTRSRDAAKARVDEWQKRVTALEDKKKSLTASLDLLNKQLQAVSVASKDFFILNAPMLDFVAPTFKVDQVVLPDLFVDMNYMSVPRVDRCQTCHRAIDRPGFESKKEAVRLSAELQRKLDNFEIVGDKRADTEQRIAQLKKIADAPDDQQVLNPWRTHPKLDLFVGSASPHPLLEYGCTACHRGQDRATEFGRAGHTPPNRAMEKRWEAASPWTLGMFPTKNDLDHRRWGYEPNEFNETPMYARQHYEAGCLKCHAGQMRVKGGDEINRATHRVELYGCYACHKINNWRFSDLRKPGPDLNGIAEKTTPDWAFRWISEPHDFRSTTRMPSFFYQRNMVGPYVPAAEKAQNIKYQDAEIHSIVSFLFAKSTNRSWGGAPAGDSARGKAIVDNVGCLGCHVDTETVKDAKSGAMRVARRDDFPLERNYGFNLTGVGTKTHPGWIFNWVKNPKNYYPDAPMPSLRLSDQEAADVTAYLMTLQKPQFMQKPIRPADPRAVHDLAKAYLINTLTDVDAEAKLKRMTLDDQLVYLGQRSIEKYGCYSCHNIKGFEGLKPIGTELTIEGSKALHLFDFGFVHDYEHEDGKHEHVLHTNSSWIYNKVRSPRVYDDKRTKIYNDKLKMPNFHLTPEEGLDITTVIVGLTKERVAAEKMASRTANDRLIEEGRKRVSQHNCRACHVVDGEGRAIAPMIKDAAYLPPDLSPEGGRAQSPFLFNFLKDPSVMKIRPWLSVRMPTFHFTDEEANTLVTYFASEGHTQQFDTLRTVNASPTNVAIGKQVFTMLRCAQCHATAPVDPRNPPVPPSGDLTSLAPNLTLARVRLRHDWIPDWIRRPNEMIPGTRMPTNFPRDTNATGFNSPLATVLDTPGFAAQKAAMLPLFGGNEAELKRTMADPVALTNYLRDYIWSIGITDMPSAEPTQGIPSTTIPLTPTTGTPVPALRSGRLDRATGSGGGR
jgi:mono/diheme cytochrome c family protein